MQILQQGSAKYNPRGKFDHCLSVKSLEHSHGHYFMYCLWLLSHCVCVCLVAQWCPTLCNPVDCSQPGTSIHGNSPGKNNG